MRPRERAYALLLVSLSSIAFCSPTEPSGGPPPTSPAPPPPASASILPLPIEACLAPPSAQAENRRYAHYLANCVVTRPCAAAATREGERTAYSTAEVDTRREVHRQEWDGNWPTYEPQPLLRLVEGQPIPLDFVQGDAFMTHTAGEVDRDPHYAAFLAGIEATGTPQARLGVEGFDGVTAHEWARTGAYLVPEQALPVLVLVLSLLARVAGVGNRRRGAPQDGVEAKRIWRN